MSSLPIREDGSEIVSYDFDDYPIRIRWLEQPLLQELADVPHWHDDLEFNYVLSGEVIFLLDGIPVQLRPGEGIFINARQVHHITSLNRGTGKESEKAEDKPDDSSCLSLLFHPMLLCVTSQVEVSYVDPLLNKAALPYFVLRESNAWHKEILDCLVELYRVRKISAAPLRMQSLLFRLWDILYTHNPVETTELPIQKLFTLKAMLEYVHRNYTERITLEDLARVGFISKSTCLHLFKDYLRATPIEYVNSYRMKKAAKLLVETDRSVTDIAFTVGFSSSSYFIKQFHKVFGCRPLDYRKWERLRSAQITP